VTHIEAAVVPQVYETTEMVEGARRLANQVSFFCIFYKHPFQRFLLTNNVFFSISFYIIRIIQIHLYLYP
jgi:hypothetical protein